MLLRYGNKSELVSLAADLPLPPCSPQLTTKGFIGEDKAQEVEEFFKAHPVPTAERVIKQSLEAIRTNTRWLERDKEAIRKWLEEEVADK